MKQQLTFVKAQLESSHLLLQFKDDHYKDEISFLRNCLMEGLQKPPPQIELNPSFNIEVTSTAAKKIIKQRRIDTDGGDYVESNEGGTYVHGNYES